MSEGAPFCRLRQLTSTAPESPSSGSSALSVRYFLAPSPTPSSDHQRLPLQTRSHRTTQLMMLLSRHWFLVWSLHWRWSICSSSCRLGVGPNSTLEWLCSNSCSHLHPSLVYLAKHLRRHCGACWLRHRLGRRGRLGLHRCEFSLIFCICWCRTRVPHIWVRVASCPSPSHTAAPVPSWVSRLCLSEDPTLAECWPRMLCGLNGEGCCCCCFAYLKLIWLGGCGLADECGFYFAITVSVDSLAALGSIAKVPFGADACDSQGWQLVQRYMGVC